MPKRETTEGLLAKFDEVVVEDTLNIAEADLGFCERMQKLYDEKISELSLWEEKLNALKDEMPQPEFIKIRTYNYNRIDVDKDYTLFRDAQEKNPFSKGSFSLLYDLNWIRKTKIDLEEVLIIQLLYYFNNAYNLSTHIKSDFFRNEEGELVKEVRFELIVKEIIDQVGGMDLTEVGINRMKEAFRSQVAYKERIIITDTKITINDYFWFSSSWNGIKWRYDDTRLHHLISAMSFYEFGILKDNCPELQFSSEQSVYFGEFYEFDTYKKIAKMKVYKNGRMDLVFHTKGGTYDFYNFFELDKLPESRW